MKNLPLLLVTLIGTIALIVGVAVMFSKSASKAQTVDQAVLVGERRSMSGKADAKVTIVEFSDFQCPACAAIHPLIKQVKAQYPNDVAMVYRHFPLSSIHPYAQVAAQAAEVAGQDGKFWEMHDRLFEQQLVWSSLKTQDEAVAKFAEYAQEFGIDKQSFMERIESDKVKAAVAEDITVGTRINVDSTPTLYINGQKVTAPQRLAELVADVLKTE